MELVIVIAVLLFLRALTPTWHAVPQEIARLTHGLRLDLPYSKEELRLAGRILGGWQLERVSS